MTEVATAITSLGTTVGGLVTLIIVIVINGLAFWANYSKSKSLFLLLLAVPVDLVYGLSLAATNTVATTGWVLGIIVAVIGTYCLIKVAVDQIKGRVQNT